MKSDLYRHEDDILHVCPPVQAHVSVHAHALQTYFIPLQ